MHSTNLRVHTSTDSSHCSVHVCLFSSPVGRHVATKNHRLLEQPIPRSFLKLQYRVREVATKLKAERRPPVMRETVFR